MDVEDDDTNVVWDEAYTAFAAAHGPTHNHYASSTHTLPPESRGFNVSGTTGSRTGIDNDDDDDNEARDENRGGDAVQWRARKEHRGLDGATALRDRKPGHEPIDRNTKSSHYSTMMNTNNTSNTNYNDTHPQRAQNAAGDIDRFLRICRDNDVFEGSVSTHQTANSNYNHQNSSRPNGAETALSLMTSHTTAANDNENGRLGPPMSQTQIGISQNFATDIRLPSATKLPGGRSRGFELDPRRMDEAESDPSGQRELDFLMASDGDGDAAFVTNQNYTALNENESNNNNNNNHSTSKNNSGKPSWSTVGFADDPSMSSPDILRDIASGRVSRSGMDSMGRSPLGVKFPGLESSPLNPVKKDSLLKGLSRMGKIDGVDEDVTHPPYDDHKLSQTAESIISKSKSIRQQLNFHIKDNGNDYTHEMVDIEDSIPIVNNNNAQQRKIVNIKRDAGKDEEEVVVIEEEEEEDTKNDSDEYDDFFDDSIMIDDIEGLMIPTSSSSTSSTFVAPNQLGTVKSEEETMAEREQQEMETILGIKYMILSIVNRTGKKREMQMTVLNILNDQSVKTIILRDSWTTTRVKIGMYINLIGEFENEVVDESNNKPNPPPPVGTEPEMTTMILDDHRTNFLIVSPDTLISATAISNYEHCSRRSVLSEIVTSPGGYHESIVTGNLLHRLVQTCLDVNKYDDLFLLEQINFLIMSSLEDLRAAGLTEAKIRNTLLVRCREFRSWVETTLFLDSDEVDPEKSKKMQIYRSENTTDLYISKILDIEEMIWSPKYGIKGMVDLTIEITSFEDINKTGKATKYVVPLEIKTGRQKIDHVWQTLLYTLLISDRYGCSTKAGILYNMNGSSAILIPSFHDELRDLIQKRNSLANELNNLPKLPPLTNQPSNCKYCYTKSTCLLYFKALEQGTRSVCNIPEYYDEAVSHLSVNHLKFFLHWNSLITKESSEIVIYKTEIWNLSSAEREFIGECLSDMVIQSYPKISDNLSSNISSFDFIFNKVNPQKFNLKENRYEFKELSLVKCRINLGDPILISSQNGHVALAKGYITAMHPNSVTVSVDRKYIDIPLGTKEFNEDIWQVFHPRKSLQDEQIKSQRGTQPLFRLDKDEMTSGLSMLRNNLVAMLCDNTKNCKKLRRNVVDLSRPRFEEIDKFDIPEGNLNQHQVAAIKKILSSKDYSLLLGMPGTGKTTTITHLLKILQSMGKRVLLTSYTHAAVDNVLLKLKSMDVPFVRLGNQHKINELLLEDTPGFKCNTIEELELLYNNTLIVATTCLGINHPIIQTLDFDYCIVDEASQLTLPACLGPLRYCDKFVLVGDHYQLPPLVRSEEASSAGLSTSLFKLLSEKHPESVVSLSYQYRMNRELMTIANSLIYNWKLECGNVKIAERKLDLVEYPSGIEKCMKPFLDKPEFRDSIRNAIDTWVPEILSPNRPVVFVDLDELYTGDMHFNNYNAIEASMVIMTVRSLIGSGLSARDLGIITPFRNQLKFFVNNLKEFDSNLTISTIDKFQGSDKECIILSLVKYGDDVGQLLLDWRRANVAFTRAKTKMIVFGSSSTMVHNAIWGSFLKLTQLKSWKYRLKSHDWIPPNAFVENEDEQDTTEKDANMKYNIKKIKLEETC